MILASLLATTSLITLTRASPMSYATYRRRELPVDEHPELLLLYDQRGLENKDSSPRSVYDVERNYGNDVGLGTSDNSGVPNESDASDITRDKKVGLGRNSLSIVNPVDVLRQRVLLELARRKAIHDLRQMDENRRILETIGKRSVKLDAGYPRSFVQSENNENDENHLFANERVNVARHEQQHQTYTQKDSADRQHAWYDVDDAVIRGNGDDESRKMLSTYRQDRM